MGFMIKTVLGSLSAWLMIASVCAGAERPAAEVSGVFGTATAQQPANAEVQLRAGMSLDAGTVIRTAPGAAVDLYLGGGPGVIRLTQSTMVTIQQLNHTNSSTETYLH